MCTPSACVGLHRVCGCARPSCVCVSVHKPVATSHYMECLCLCSVSSTLTQSVCVLCRGAGFSYFLKFEKFTNGRL